MPDISFFEITHSKYIRYANAVNENRTIPCDVDGLKPVGRRALWAAYKLKLNHTAKLVKSARVVGDVIGKYHPHGDTACYEAIVTMARSVCVPMVQGSGNWGSFSDSGFAAMRYTEMRLSKYSDLVFFDPFYTPQIPTVLNYNEEEDFREPVVMGCLLPNNLINGNGGPGVAVSCVMPSFTLASVFKILEKVFKGEKITPKLCAKYLEFTTRYEGIPIVSKEDKLAFFKTGKGRVVFTPAYKVNEKKHEILLEHNFPDYKDVTAILDRVLSDPRVKRADNLTSTKDKVRRISVILNRSTESYKKIADEIVTKYFNNAESYEVYITDRYTKDGEVSKSDLHSSTSTKILQGWVDYRRQLEKDACTYWINKVEKEIAHRELLKKAVDFIDIIIAAIKDAKLKSTEDVAKQIAKKMKITVEEATVIVNLRVIQLRKLEKKKLDEEIAGRKQTIKGYKKRIKNTDAYLLDNLKSLKKALL